MTSGECVPDWEPLLAPADYFLRDECDWSGDCDDCGAVTNGGADYDDGDCDGPCRTSWPLMSRMAVIMLLQHLLLDLMHSFQPLLSLRPLSYDCEIVCLFVSRLLSSFFFLLLLLFLIYYQRTSFRLQPCRHYCFTV